MRRVAARAAAVITVPEGATLTTVVPPRPTAIIPIAPGTALTLLPGAAAAVPTRPTTLPAFGTRSFAAVAPSAAFAVIARSAAALASVVPRLAVATLPGSAAIIAVSIGAALTAVIVAARTLVPVGPGLPVTISTRAAAIVTVAIGAALPTIIATRASTPVVIPAGPASSGRTVTSRGTSIIVVSVAPAVTLALVRCGVVSHGSIIPAAGPFPQLGTGRNSPKRNKPPEQAQGVCCKKSGGVLVSHEVPLAVPSAQRGLTSGFGMGPGVSLSLWPPKHYGDSDRAHAFSRVLSCCAPDRISGTSQWTRSIFVETSPRPISIGQLHTLLYFHIRPITLWSTRGLTRLICGSPHLEMCFPLRCFQRLSRPNVANQPCFW